jgi:putative hydrolase of the HAD superfamily
MNEYLKTNLNFDEQRIMRLQAIFLHFNKKVSQDDAQKIFYEYLRIYEASWECFNDVNPCMQKLKKYKLGIISNGDKDQQIKKLKTMDIYRFFDYFIISSEVGCSKPDRKIFEIACKKANVLPKNSVYVGDNVQTDIAPAEDIGINAVLIDRNNEYQEKKYKRINSLNQLSLD